MLIRHVEERREAGGGSAPDNGYHLFVLSVVGCEKVLGSQDGEVLEIMEDG